MDGGWWVTKTHQIYLLLGPNDRCIKRMLQLRIHDDFIDWIAIWTKDCIISPIIEYHLHLHQIVVVASQISKTTAVFFHVTPSALEES